MALVLVFSITLLWAVLLSSHAQRTVLSTAVLFLLAGLLLGCGVFGAVPAAHSGLLQITAELALFSVLFTDGMRTQGLRALRAMAPLLSRVLALGLPATIVALALLARWLLGLPWLYAFLLGAVLSPTDPVFISAILEQRAVPGLLRSVLNFESGINDGLVLPVVLLLLAPLNGSGPGLGSVGADLVLGLALGVALPWLAVWLETRPYFGAVGIYEPLNGFAIGLLVLAVCLSLRVNFFLAAFAAGLTVTTINAPVRDSFAHFGEFVTELLKCAALLIFGLRLAPDVFLPLSGREWIVIVAGLFGVRLLVLPACLWRSALPARDRWIAGWFGPKGFASVVYGLMILRLGTPVSQRVAHLVGVTILISIVLYSSTDIFVARWYAARHPPARA